MGYKAPASPDLAVRALLDSRDTDRVAGLVHALLGEVATLAARLEALEAKCEGREARTDQEAVDSTVSAIVRRVMGSAS